MPVANFEGLTLTYTFTHTVSRSTMADSRHTFRRLVVPGTQIAYAIRPEETSTKSKSYGEVRPASLWITGKTIDFDASIQAAGPPPAIAEWQAGFLQTITGSNRNAHYANGVNRLFKFDTSFGPLTDGRTTPYYGDPVPLEPQPAQVYEDDSPNFDVPLVLGDGAHPGGEPLQRTSGQDVFQTYLVVTRERDKSVVVLGRVDWRIDWSGTFQNTVTAGPSWTPTNPVTFFQANQTDYVQEYINLRATHQQTPFSLRMAEAETFSRVNYGDGWKRCNPSGDTSQPSPIVLRTWVNAP